MEVKTYIDQYINGIGKNKGRNPLERYASFDYCYNYFYSFYQAGKISELASDRNLQLSCLQVGFYLASWGMMRGSAFLLEKSAAHYRDLIVTIAHLDESYWTIDLDNYTPANVAKLMDCKKKIAKALRPPETQKKPTDTLITKIMLGIFASVPALDIYVRTALKVSSMTVHALEEISQIYDSNRRDFDCYYNKLYTYNFLSSRPTTVKYTKAKIMDMYAFMAGQYGATPVKN